VSKPVAIGVDIGSTTWKSVVIDSSGTIIAKKLEQSDPLIEKQTVRALDELRAECGASSDIPVGATGYGRKQVKANKILTEISCHARGAYHHTQDAGLLVDIGGQDTKVITIASNGDMTDFFMNDKCAAGTGRFLEVILNRLNVPFEGIDKYVELATDAIPISSTCTVFAESEVVSLLATGKDVKNIVKGLHISLASRVSALAGKVGPDTNIFMSGGVSHNAAMVDALSQSIGRPIQVLPDPQFIGALGAALSVL